jgi:hypothetical protein
MANGMAVLGTLLRLPGRILRRLATGYTSDVMALDLSGLHTAPDMRGWELTVVSSDLGRVEVRRLIEDALPRRLCEEFIATVARGGLLYMLFKNGRVEHYNWVGTTERHEALFVAGPGDAVGWNAWTIREARGNGLLGLSVYLMGWHMKQQGLRRILAAVDIGNAPSMKVTRRTGHECLGRYTMWTLLGCIYFRIEHAARGRRRYRFFFGLSRRKAPKLRHPASLPKPEPSST